MKIIKDIIFTSLSTVNKIANLVVANLPISDSLVQPWQKALPETLLKPCVIDVEAIIYS